MKNSASVVAGENGPGIFLSHSSGGTDVALRLRKYVYDHLVGRGDRVFLDEQGLQPGDDWRRRLHVWLAVCTGAVVFLDHRALTSTWVRREVNILLWRRDLGAGIDIIPVLLPGVTRSDVGAAGLGELEDLQFALCGDDVVKDTDLKSLAEDVVSRLPNATTTDHHTPLEQWLDTVSHYLRHVSPTALDLAAQELGDRRADVSRMEHNRFVAAQFLVRDLDESCYRALGKVAWQITSDEGRRLVDLLAPTWVAAESARSLLSNALRAGSPVLALDTSKPETFRHYIDRATCCAAAGYPKTALDGSYGEGGAAEVVARAERELKKVLGIRNGELPRKRPSERLFQAVLLGMVVGDGTTTVVYEAVAMLRDRYPWLSVTLLGPHDPPSEMTETIMIKPAMDSDRERDADQLILLMRNLPW